LSAHCRPPRQIVRMPLPSVHILSFQTLSGWGRVDGATSSLMDDLKPNTLEGLDIFSRLSYCRGWLLCCTILGALIGPEFFTSAGTNSIRIEYGIALYSLFGATLCFFTALAIRLYAGSFRSAQRRISESVLCCVILAFLLYRYLVFYETLRDMISRSG
jgi:hypothetical protein